jgi:hypothetical protein
MNHSHPPIAVHVDVAIYVYLLSGIFLLSKPKTMKRKQILLLSLLSSSIVYSQIGVNTEDPKSTLHIKPTKEDGTTAEGIIAPNLTRAQLITKDSKYTTAQKGSIVYVTDLSGTLTTKTLKITQIGYYYFDGENWQQFGSSAGGSIPREPWLKQGTIIEATSNTENIYQTGSVHIGKGTTVPSDYKLMVTGKTNLQDDLILHGVLKGEGTGNSYFGGNLGLGTAEPAQRLDVRGNQIISGTSTLQGNTTIGKAGVANTTPGTGDLRVHGTGVVGTSNVVYPNTNYTMHVLGKGTIGGLWVENYANLKHKVSIGENLTAADNALTVSKGNTTLNGKVGIGQASGNETLIVKGSSLLNGTTQVGTSAEPQSLKVLGETNIQKTTITGQLRYTLDSPLANKVLIAKDAQGNLTWGTAQSLVTIPTEPWQVQGSTTAATGNGQNIYQKGNVAIGANVASTTIYDKSLYVNGATLLDGITQVGISTAPKSLGVHGTLTATGNTTIGKAGVANTTPGTGDLRVHGTGIVGTQNVVYPNTNYTMHVFGTGKLGGLWVENYANLKHKVSVGENLTATDDALIVSKGKTTLNGKVGIGRAPATGNFALVVTGNTNNSGNLIVGNESVNIEVGRIFQVNGRSNITGNSKVASSTVVGNETVGGTLGVTGAVTLASTLKIAGKTNQNGDFQYAGHGAANGHVLSSDANGNATWKNQNMLSGSWFYLPSLNMDMSTTTVKTIDLFAKGVSQLLAAQTIVGSSPSAAKPTLPTTATAYDYIVIGSSGHITGISINASGVMTYTPTTVNPPLDAYVNIIVRVK